MLHGISFKHKDKLKEIISNLDINSKILIVDDIDTDGVMSAVITNESFKNFPNREVYVNDKHGFTDLDYGKKFDLVIIVDSSSELAHTYGDLKQTIIIDHHLYTPMRYPDNVLLINTHDNPGYESLSAGMFCYQVWKEISKEIETLDVTEDLFSLGIVSLYGDMVPCSPIVREYIEEFIRNIQTETNIHSLLSFFSPYHPSKSSISYSISPTINYTRKLIGTDKTMEIFYRGFTSLVKRDFQKNASLVKGIIKHIVDENEPTEYNNFVYMELPSMFKDRYKNFKGLVANKLVEKYNKPAKVGTRLDNGVVEISIRSEGYNSREFIKDNNLSGGGHAVACGYKILQEELETILNQYDNNLLNYKLEDNIVGLCDTMPTSREEVYELAYENEFRYVEKEHHFIMEVNPTEINNIDTYNKTFTVTGLNHSFKMFNIYQLVNKIDEAIEQNLEKIKLLSVPTIESHKAKTCFMIADLIS